MNYKAVVGAKHSVGAERYKVQHTVPAAQLRPAWGWTERTMSWAQSR